MPTQWEDVQRLELATRVGKEVWLNERSSGMPILWGIVEDEVGLVVDDAKHVIQRIRLAKDVSWDESEYGYKTGSFTIDARTGSVKWAQYSQVVSEQEYRELLTKARAKGWPVFDDA
jgi:hypothetical protein